MRITRAVIPLFYKPPFCFIPPVAITVASGIVIGSDHQLVPLIINVFIGAMLGYPMGCLYAWADIAYVAEIAAAAREKPWIRTLGNFLSPVILDKSYAIRTLIVFAIVIVGMSGTALAIYSAYRVFPNARLPWAQFYGVPFDDALINNIGRTISVYAFVVTWTVTIIEYRWFKNLEN